MTVWGYARVSTADQDVTAQANALSAAGVGADNLVIEYASGARADRPVLTTLLEQLTAGDVLTVWKLDRLGRSLTHLVQTVDALGRRGIQFRSLTEGMDTTTATGRLTFHIVGAMAEFERELIRERTKAGLEAAKGKGAKLGRPSHIKPEQLSLIYEMSAAGNTQIGIANSTGLTRAQVGRVLRGEIASLRSREEGGHDGLPLYEANS